MKIKFGALVTDGRGKLGGHVASKNRGGSYLRTKVTPSNPQTVAQSQARALFGAISQQWSGLTEAVRAGFDEAVSEWQKTDIFGDLKSPTGKNLFQRLNNQAQAGGYPAVVEVPNKLEMVEGIVTFFDMNLTDSSIEQIGLYSGADARIMFFATAQLSQGTKFVKNKLRLIDTQLASTLDENAVFTAYVNKFGTPSVGDNIYYGIKYVLPNGQVSPIQTVKCPVIAT